MKQTLRLIPIFLAFQANAAPDGVLSQPSAGPGWAATIGISVAACGIVMFCVRHYKKRRAKNKLP